MRSFEDHLAEAYEFFDRHWPRTTPLRQSAETRQAACEIMAYFAMQCEARVEAFCQAQVPEQAPVDPSMLLRPPDRPRP